MFQNCFLYFWRWLWGSPIKLKSISSIPKLLLKVGLRPPLVFLFMVLLLPLLLRVFLIKCINTISKYFTVDSYRILNIMSFTNMNTNTTIYLLQSHIPIQVTIHNLQTEVDNPQTICCNATYSIISQRVNTLSDSRK